MDYDACNEELAQSMGTADYCQELFKDQNSFTFWGDSDIKDQCVKISSAQVNSADKCASLNEGMFNKYHETHQGVLAELVDQSKVAISLQNAKDKKLKQFLEDDDDDLKDAFTPKLTK
jgi:hypothetical protein